MLGGRELREERSLGGAMNRNRRSAQRVLPFSFVRGANDNGHLVLQYEKTKKENSPMLDDSTS